MFFGVFEGTTICMIYEASDGGDCAFQGDAGETRRSTVYEYHE